MTIVYDKLMALDIAPAEQIYDAKDCMLYALGVGFGHDPMNEDELAFVYEKNLKVLPTMATVLAHSGSLARNPDSGINWVMVVNGEQGFTLERPLVGEGTLIGRTRIVEVIDKGAGKGALLLTERKITDKATGAPIGTVTQTIFCRGDGGFGGPPRQSPPPHPIPSRAPDAVCDFGTRPEMALIYRLSGDYNPLHAEPAAAKAAGFDAADPARARHVRRVGPCFAENHVRVRSERGSSRSRAGFPHRCFPARPFAPRCGAMARS